MQPLTSDRFPEGSFRQKALSSIYTIFETVAERRIGFPIMYVLINGSTDHVRNRQVVNGRYQRESFGLFGRQPNRHGFWGTHANFLPL